MKFPMAFGDQVRWFCRLVFVGLFLFELANYFGLLKFSLDYTWFGLLITLFGASVGLEGTAYVLRKKFNIEMPWIAWPIGLGAVLFDVIGDIGHFYETFRWYDQVAHYIGTMASTTVFLAFFRVVQKSRGWQYPPTLNLVLALAMGLTLGVLYEIEEYSEDVISGSSRLGNGRDTANDLLLNFLGASTVVFFAWIQQTLLPRFKTYFNRAPTAEPVLGASISTEGV